MRILTLTSLYPNPWDPNRAPFNRQQFAALAARHEVRLIAPVAWTKRVRRLPDAPSERFVLRDSMVIEHPRYLYPPKVLRSWHGTCFFHTSRPAFDRAVRAFEPQIVLGSWAYPDAWAALKLARGANLPLVAKVHGSDVLLLDGRGARRRQTTDALRGADAVVGVSRQIVQRVAELGVDPARVHLNYNGVDTNLFHPCNSNATGAKLNL